MRSFEKSVKCILDHFRSYQVILGYFRSLNHSILVTYSFQLVKVLRVLNDFLFKSQNFQQHSCSIYSMITMDISRMWKTFVLEAQSPGLISSYHWWAISLKRQCRITLKVNVGRFIASQYIKPLTTHRPELFVILFERNRDFEQLIFSILLRNCCQLPSAGYVRISTVAILQIPITSCTISFDAFESSNSFQSRYMLLTTGNLNKTLPMLQAAEKRFQSIPKNQDCGLQGNGLSSQYSSLRFRINRARHLTYGGYAYSTSGSQRNLAAVPKRHDNSLLLRS